MNLNCLGFKISPNDFCINLNYTEWLDQSIITFRLILKIHRRWKIQRHSYLNCISFYSFVLRHGKSNLIIVQKINFLTKLLCKLYCDISHTSVFVRIHTQRQRMQFRDHIVINFKINVKNSSRFTNWNEFGHGSPNSELSMFAIEIFINKSNRKMDQEYAVRTVFERTVPSRTLNGGKTEYRAFSQCLKV